MLFIPHAFPTEFNGDNLMVDISSDTDLTFYCGRCHLFATITDLKNTVNIDPNMENNYKGRPIILNCPTGKTVCAQIHYITLSVVGHGFLITFFLIIRWISDITIVLYVALCAEFC